MTEPQISIVIPAFNEEERLPRFLDSVLTGLGALVFGIVTGVLWFSI